jgi:hypothetical protein
VQSVYVRLTCKLANRLNGIDVTEVRTGDVIELPGIEAAMLIAEGWAEQVSDDIATQRSKKPSKSPKEHTGDRRAES